MTSNGAMNMPIRPVHTLPLSTTTTASGNVNTIATMTTVRNTIEWASCQRGTKNISGCNPSTSSPPTATAAKTASTEVRPSSSQ
jgi:hypothetical protein